MSETFVLEQFPFPTNKSATRKKGIQRRRIYIMPTRHGVIYGLMLFAMSLGAINYNNSMAYILTFLLFSLSLVTILHTYRNIAGLVINEATPDPVFSGEFAKFRLNINNRDKHLRLSIFFVNVPKKWRLLPFTNPAPIASYSINTNEFADIVLPIKTLRRGKFFAGRIKIYTTFPLGLFKAWSYIDTQQYCTVYPEPLGQTALPAFKLTETIGNQGTVSGTDDFTGFRNYREGDSIKDIAWKAYAQQRGLFIKRFTGNGSNELHLSWNDVAHLPDIEMKLSQLCLWVIEAESRYLQYSLETPETYIESGYGDKHFHQCLSTLAHYNINVDTLKK